MIQRKILKMLQGEKTIDGAGVRLVRVLGKKDTEDFDPFLMLDSFDSSKPQDYIAGFPMHPHRGIETITYLIHGQIEHRDSLGNEDVIHPGDSQWMTAGSGILHEEMPQASQSMLGFQLWLNLPAAQKMTEPSYLSITKDMIPLITSEEGEVRVISGNYLGERGTTPSYISASIFDIDLKSKKKIKIPGNPEEKVFVFIIKGELLVQNQKIKEKTAVLFDHGDYIEICAADQSARFIYFSGKALHEPIAWGGPIVMNTKEELKYAFDELEKGTFIKHT